MKNKFYITTPIFYPNAELHLGHAYNVTIVDIQARYHRMIGHDTYFLTGSDEHSEKVVRAAEKAGKKVEPFLNEIVGRFKSLYTSLNISYDNFLRTSDKEEHWPGAIALWKKLDESGDLYKKEYKGLYCVGAETFVTKKDLVDGKCPDHDEEPQVLSEENYFFRLSNYTDLVKEKIESDELMIFPETRKKEILSFIKNGLEDVSFSRAKKNSSWGIPVPGDDSQIMYVWCDALANYLSTLGYGSATDDNFKKFWPADFHVIGKDILRFHAAIWPAMLLSAGLPLPKKIFVHGLMTSGGRKMSKSLGNIIKPIPLIEEYGADAVRYYLSREISPFEDGEMTEERFREVYNGNLANGLGNLVSRVMKMAEDNLDGPINISEESVFPEEYTNAVNAFELNKAMDYIWRKIGDADQKITETEPFKLVKTDKEKAKEIISELVLELYQIARLLTPFMPDTSEKIKEAVLQNKKPETLFARK